MKKNFMITKCVGCILMAIILAGCGNAPVKSADDASSDVVVELFGLH